jgi:hypothetical protein
MLKILCRVSDSWHSAKKLKKMTKILCRVPDRGHSAKYVIDATSTPSISTCVITISHVVCRVSSNVRHNFLETFLFFYHSLHIWYHDILKIFIIFGLGLCLIEFKNKSSASRCPYFVNTMFEISGAFLDSSS